MDLRIPEKRRKPDTQEMPLPARLLGWLLGSMSLLNLAEDMGFVRILGRLKVWLDAYTWFVEAIGGFLFGWIQLGWISISRTEMHALVIAGLFCTTLSKVLGIRLRKEFYFPRWGQVLVGSALAWVVSFALALIPALLLPGVGGIVGLTIGMSLLVCLVTVARKDIGGGLLVRELASMSATFVLMVVVNYAVFRLV